MDNTVFSVIDNTVRKVKNNKDFCEEDYRNSEGLLICGKCHTAREKFVNFDKASTFYERYKNHVFPVLCKCRKEKEEAEEKRLRQAETERLITKFRRKGITDENYLKYTFFHDDNKNPSISRACKKYADSFEDMYRLGKGLIFCGQVGTGKTFYAGCIANEVISQARSVLMTNIPSLITKLGFNQEEKSHVLNKITYVSLLVIDYLGVERDTSYSLKKVYEIIDTRYSSGKPLIITTNLKFDDMKTSENTSYIWIYDRILQMCATLSPFLEKAEEVRTL